MLNIVPLNDCKSHLLDTMCPCDPKVEFLCEILITHNSFDGREREEVLGHINPKKPWKIIADHPLDDFED